MRRDTVIVGSVVFTRYTVDAFKAPLVLADQWAAAFCSPLTAADLVLRAQQASAYARAEEGDLVTAHFAASAVAGAARARAAAAFARIMFNEPTPLPAQLPDLSSIRAAASLLDAGGDGVAADDDGEGVVGEGAAGEAALPVGELIDSDVVNLHLQLLESYLSTGIDLSRDAVKLQGACSIRNIKGNVVRFLHFCCTEASRAQVEDGGLFMLANGELLLKWISFMLKGKSLKLVTVATSAYSLQKARAPLPGRGRTPLGCARGSLVPHRQGVEFLAKSIAPEPAAAWATYRARVKVFLQQLQALQTNATVAKARTPPRPGARRARAQPRSATPRSSRAQPTFAEEVASQKFMPLADILAKSVPWATGAHTAWSLSRTLENAIRLRDAGVLMMIAGDGVPNVRPTELKWLADARLGGCLDGGCAIQGCRGSTAEVTPAGDVLFKARFVHGRILAHTRKARARSDPAPVARRLRSTRRQTARA